MFARLGFVDTLVAAFVPWLASAFEIFLMRRFFLSLPSELEDAGRIDGWACSGSSCCPWRNRPLVAINNEAHYTIQLGLANFQGTRRTQWSLLMAGNVVATMPLVLAFLLAKRQFVATMTFSGLKG
jgi:multiple sugar transport system permease protein